MNTDNGLMHLKHKLLDAKRRNEIDQKYALHHIGHQRWDIISKHAGENMELWKQLYEVGKIGIKNTDTTNNHIYCGEQCYLIIKQRIINECILDIPAQEMCANNKSKKITNKAEIIKRANLEKKIKNEIDALILLKPQNPLKSSQQISFKSKYFELTVVKMMIQCENLLKDYQLIESKLMKATTSKYTLADELTTLRHKLNEYHDSLTEMIVGFNKIASEKSTNTEISKTCLQDLTYCLDRAKKYINFDAFTVILNKPELIFKTIYDSMLEKKPLHMYPSQKEIFNFVTENQKYLALVHTMLGSGKTSMVLPICGWLTANRRSNMHTKILFCCPNEVVLLEVAHMLYAMGVAFAIVIHDIAQNILVYKWSSFVDTKNPKSSAILYLCDMFVARMLLEERAQAIADKSAYLRMNSHDDINYPLIETRIPIIPDYIMIADEPTKDADTQDNFLVDCGFSVITEIFVNIMHLAPPRTILMSATLPTINQLSNFYNSILTNTPGMVIKSFASSEAKIGCAMISANGEIYAPHTDSTSCNEIANILDTIKTNPFIGRFYTFEVLLSMVQTFSKIGLQVPNLNELYDNPSKANQTAIQQTAYDMLETLIATQNNETICQACQFHIGTQSGIDMSKILTQDIHKFNKGLLVFSCDPVETALQTYISNFNGFLKDSNRTIFQQIRLDNIITKYNREIDLYNKSINRIIQKSDDGISRQNKLNNKKDTIKEESWKTISRMSGDKPVWDFPHELQLCSIEHLTRVGCDKLSNVNACMTPSDLPKDSRVSIEILTLLASGIGVYSTTSNLLDDIYLKSVISLAKSGLIKVIFADSSIAYGTNLAVSDIIIIDQQTTHNNGTIIPSIVDCHSIKTVFQMLGRAGRGGNLSYEATVYTTSENNNLINKIKLYTRGLLNEGVRDEIGNIDRAFQILN